VFKNIYFFETKIRTDSDVVIEYREMVVRQQVLRPGFLEGLELPTGGRGEVILMLFTCTIIKKNIMNENKSRHRVHLFVCVCVCVYVE